MGACRRAGIAHIANEVSSFYPLTRLYGNTAPVAIKRFVTVSMVHNHAAAITTIQTCCLHLTVTGGVDRCAGWRGEINAGMHFTDFINRVYPNAETRNPSTSLPRVNGLYSRYTCHHLSL